MRSAIHTSNPLGARERFAILEGCANSTGADSVDYLAAHRPISSTSSGWPNGTTSTHNSRTEGRLMGMTISKRSRPQAGRRRWRLATPSWSSGGHDRPHRSDVRHVWIPPLRITTPTSWPM